MYTTSKLLKKSLPKLPFNELGTNAGKLKIVTAFKEEKMLIVSKIPDIAELRSQLFELIPKFESIEHSNKHDFSGFSLGHDYIFFAGNPVQDPNHKPTLEQLAKYPQTHTMNRWPTTMPEYHPIVLKLHQILKVVAIEVGSALDRHMLSVLPNTDKY